MDTSDVSRIPLDSSMPAIEGFRAVLSYLADDITGNWQGTLDRSDPECLHDLRVAVRRTRTVIAQGRHVLPPTTLASARQRFAWFGQLTGPARDLDVLVLGWPQITSELAEPSVVALQPVLGALSKRRQVASDRLIEAMQSPAVIDLMGTWRAWLHSTTPLEPSGRHATLPVGHVVAKRIDRLQHRVVLGGRSIGEQTPDEQIHQLRKDAKKLRYMVECFGSMMPKGKRTAFVRRLKAIQDGLGDHQDAVVHAAEVRAVAKALHAAGSPFDTPPWRPAD